MNVYVTFFNVGKDSEGLVIDYMDETDQLIVWSSEDEYFAARGDFKIIGGGVFTYGLAAGTAGAPHTLISNQIVSFRATHSLLALLDILDATVKAMRSADWPEWPGL